MANTAKTINLSEKQKAILEEFAKGIHVYLDIKRRAELIIAANEGMPSNEISRRYNYDRECVTKWRNRWAARMAELEVTEREKPHKLREEVEMTLRDAERSGKPPIFTAEQVAHIITLSCQLPEQIDDKTPISHWTASELARKAQELDIVKSISARQVGRFLKRSRYQATSDQGMVESQN
jgi:putative transposase